jgi:pimeloyl-ACP methyl ester carboxylesterase
LEFLFRLERLGAKAEFLQELQSGGRRHRRAFHPRAGPGTESDPVAPFARQGGDWGAFITSSLGMKHPERVLGIHLNLLAIPRNPNEAAATEEEKRYIGELKQFQKEEMGYQWIQGTRPQTLAYGLTDSPAGLAAWIVEKFRAWSDNDGTPESAILEQPEVLAHEVKSFFAELAQD